ncbi:MAG: thiamine pyrophosphate-dependent enzyme [Thermoplasmatota archaeon]
MSGEDIFDMGDIDIAWCPGCGNFAIHQALKEALDELGAEPKDVVMLSGIGQAAKIPQYLRCNMFNGLHGRSLPPATLVKAVNPELTVIAESGDGDMYGEGGNHFIHAIRRNPDMVNIVHNNMIYGLTKGQASPTSGRDLRTSVQPNGVILEPFNPIAVALSLGAGFVARSFSGDKGLTKELIKEAVEFEGYALIDIFQPCVSFNKLNTHKWFKEHTSRIDEGHDVTNRADAFGLAMEEDPLPVGIFYKKKEKEPYHKLLDAYEDDGEVLWKRDMDRKELLKEELFSMR